MKVYVLIAHPDSSPGGGYVEGVFESLEGAKQVVDAETKKEYARARKLHIARFGTPYKKNYQTGKWSEPYPEERPGLVWHDTYDYDGGLLRSWSGDYEIEEKETKP